MLIICECSIKFHKTGRRGQTVDKALLAALINKLPQKIGGKTPTVVHITPDGLSIPNSALYTINANHPNLPIFQTDPAFTNHKNWLSSPKGILF